MKLEISQQSIEKSSVIKFYENQHRGFGWTDGQTDMTDVIVTFHSFANALKSSCNSCKNTRSYFLSYFNFTTQVSVFTQTLLYCNITKCDTLPRLQGLKTSLQVTVIFTSYWNIFFRITNFNTIFENLDSLLRTKWYTAQRKAWGLFPISSKIIPPKMSTVCW
jgi:hypothetical protein